MQHVIELRVMLGKLKTLPVVRARAVAYANSWGICDITALVSKVLLHWLDHRCLLCGGTGEKPVKGASMLSGKECRGCSGSGMTECPGGEDGKRLACWFDETVTEAQSNMKQLLRKL